MLLATLNSERFADTAPAAVDATLLGERTYLGAVRTMYRLLAATGARSERRIQLTHPAYTKPESLELLEVVQEDAGDLFGPSIS